MTLFFASESRFQTDSDRKAWFEQLIAEVCTQALAAFPAKMMPIEFKQLQRAANNVAYGFIEHAPAAKQIAKAVIFGVTCDAKRKDETIKALTAIIFTAAAEMVNHRNHFTVGYHNNALGVACQNLLADARKRTTASNFEALQYDNFTMIGNIARSYCNNEELTIEAALA